MPVNGDKTINKISGYFVNLSKIPLLLVSKQMNYWKYWDIEKCLQKNEDYVNRLPEILFICNARLMARKLNA